MSNADAAHIGLFLAPCGSRAKYAGRAQPTSAAVARSGVPCRRSAAAEGSRDVSYPHGQADLKTFEGARVADRVNEAKPSKEAVARARTFRRRQTLEEVDPDPDS